MLLQAGGLAELRGTRLGLTRAGAKALGAEPASVIRTVWERWLATRILDELARVDAIRGQTGKGKRGLTAVADRRGAVADALADCQLGRWVALDELLRYMRAAGHRFEVTRNAWTLYIGEAGYGSLGYDGCSGWNILQARYALCLLFEYAATLGLIDVAFVPPAGARPDYTDLWGADHLEYLSRYDGLQYLRLSALGTWCLGVAETYAPPRIEAAPVFTILANLELAVTGSELTYTDRVVLERYAEQTSDRVWRLDREKLLAAIEDGDSVAGVREFLDARAVTPIPESVTSLLDEVAQTRRAPRRPRADAGDRLRRPGARRATRQRLQDAGAVHRGRRGPAARPERPRAGLPPRRSQAGLRGPLRRTGAQGRVAPSQAVRPPGEPASRFEPCRRRKCRC